MAHAADCGEMPVCRRILRFVETVGVDESQGEGKFGRALVVIDDDDVDSCFPGGG